MTSSTDLRITMPHASLTAITGTPSFVSLRLLKQELFANAASVSSSLTAPDIGHAMLVIGDPTYIQLATDAQNAEALAAGVAPPAAYVWNPPIRPPAQPVIAAVATNAAIARAKEEWLLAQTDYNAFTNAKSVLKQQILNAVPHNFVSSLKHELTGFSTVTPRQLVAHLETTYGNVTRSHLDANLVALETPWDPSDSMEDLWTRCAQCEHIAAAGNETISPALKMRLMLKVLTQSGLFSLDIRDWNKRPVAQRTWDDFKTFFGEANRERCANLTAGDYRHQANVTVTRSAAKSPTFSEITQGTFSTSGASEKPIKFCWTHGCFPYGNGHTSRECTNKKKGHKEDANIFNMLGGNNSIRRKPNERDDYTRINFSRDDTTTNNPKGRDRGKRGDKANLTAESDADATTSEDTIDAVAAVVLARLNK